MAILIEAADLRRYNRLQAELAAKQAEFSLLISEIEVRYDVTVQRDQINFQAGTITRQEERDATDPQG